ncbi:hypothetical protein U3516DRAFT_901629 [Neocallimastix sp. 'constans']
MMMMCMKILLIIFILKALIVILIIKTNPQAQAINITKMLSMVIKLIMMMRKFLLHHLIIKIILEIKMTMKII